MPLDNLFIRKKRSIGGIKLDGVIVERFSDAITPTQNPVEFGAVISDHAIIQPKRYIMDAVVTDTPFGLFSEGAIIDRFTNLFGDSTGKGLTRSQTAYSQLKELMNKREPINVLNTGLLQLNNMLITRLTTSRDKDTANALFFTMELQEIIIVNTEVLERPTDISSGDTQMRSSSPINEGRKIKKQTEDRSVFSKIFF